MRNQKNKIKKKKSIQKSNQQKHKDGSVTTVGTQLPSEGERGCGGEGKRDDGNWVKKSGQDRQTHCGTRMERIKGTLKRKKTEERGGDILGKKLANAGGSRKRGICKWIPKL